MQLAVHHRAIGNIGLISQIDRMFDNVGIVGGEVDVNSAASLFNDSPFTECDRIDI